MSKKFVLAGFANSGKTTLFNQLTSTKQKTGNWAGVTVSVKQQTVLFNGESVIFTDIPGVPSLAKRQQQSSDLSITHDYLQQEKIDCIINVVDATQLQRQLYLTTQLLELGLPMLVVLSKSDRKEAAKVDIEKLTSELGCPVMELDSRAPSSFEIIAQALTVMPTCSKLPPKMALPESLANNLEQNEQSLLDIECSLTTQCSNCAQDNDTVMQIMQARYNFVEQTLLASTISKSEAKSLSERIDNIVLHPLMGIPVFLLMMYLLFMFAINVGSAFIDFFDILAGAIFVEYPAELLAPFNMPAWSLTIVEGFGSGIQTVATFIPVIVCLFIGLSILETSGYLARAAFVVENVMHKIGLPGKAFVPLIVGFGCTVPAVMSARVLDSERERITTIMMSPFMSCGARLPVYALFAAAFFPESGQNIVFLLYLIGIAAAIFTGFLLKITVLSGSNSVSIMELPLYEMPQLTELIRRVWRRTRSFVMGAGKTIVLVVCFLNFFNSLGTDGQFGHHDSDSSVLSKGAQVVTPLLSPIGIKEENWQASVGIITGIFAKEALVATFNSLYSPTKPDGGDDLNFGDIWTDATGSIKENLMGIVPEDPLGVDVGDVSDLAVAAQEQEVEVTTYTAMQNAFAGQIGAFSYLLFILLYTPCAAAMGAIKNEVGNRWAIFAALWSFTFAYLVSTFVYQVTQLPTNTLFAVVSLTMVMVIFSAIYLWLKHQGKQILTLPVRVSYAK
ncbi:ferrous iron transport protein B [Thalassotalea atypica]|uniref:ferrous iron transport protein B n=1 Tax=Thalassotalea atypica TaxID=2054316 RepID=UPI0025728CA4|nr:ferrous iron transport protein B [Thalassotalea atypica]